MSEHDMSPSTPPNGVPISVDEEENTGQHILAEVAATAAGPGNSNEALAGLILTALKGNGNGNGGDAGAKVLKDIKKHKWLAVLMTLIVGPGSMTATYYAIKDRGIANEAAVQQLTQDATEIHPKIERNIEDIRFIKVDISKIKKSVSDLKGQNTDIAIGVESLKKVNVDRLKEENDKLERKIRVLERERNR